MIAGHDRRPVGKDLEKASCRHVLPHYVVRQRRQAETGKFAVELLAARSDEAGAHCIEGPARYTPTDVALAMEKAFHRPVNVEIARQESWRGTLRALGYSEAAAKSYAGTKAATLTGEFPPLDQVTRGKTTLAAYLDGKRG